MDFFYRLQKEGLVFKVFIQPKSAKNGIVGLHGDALKIKITAPPVDGAANKMCIEFLAKCLDTSPSCLEILSGHNSRNKLILFRSQEEKEILYRREILKNLIQKWQSHYFFIDIGEQFR
jgi:uncharacterized protein (TIGR00251 family)